MTYSNTDKSIRVGDSVLYAGAPARIVFVVDDDAYSDRYPRNDWSYLAKGLGIEIQDQERTLYHLDAPDEDLLPMSSDTGREVPTAKG